MNLLKIGSLVILMLIFSCIEKKNDWKESEETFVTNQEKQEEIIEKYL